MYSFNLNGQRNLVTGCYARGGRHDYVNGARVPGPNVFVNSSAEQMRSDIGPHHRWATGSLFDNIVAQGYEIRVQNRRTSGSGHGWAGAQTMFWNCTAPSGIVNQSPYGHVNWAIGSGPNVTNAGHWYTAEGFNESVGTFVYPQSLYERQLAERLGSVTPQTYTVEISTLGEGSVSLSPESESYVSGTEVTLTATPDEGHLFTGWSGDLSGTENSVTIIISEDMSVVASFTSQVPFGTQKLTIVSAEAGAEREGNPKENSFDGNDTARWANDQTLENAWIIYDLGETSTVNALRVKLNVGATRTYELRIEVGDEDFTEVWSGTTAFNVGLQTLVVSEATGRYVRFTMTEQNSSDNNWFSIFETEVWGREGDLTGMVRSVENGRFKWSSNVNRTALILTTSTEAVVDVVLYDIRGRAVSVLHSGLLHAGTHIFNQKARVPSGLYMLTVRGRDGREFYKRKMTIVE